MCARLRLLVCHDDPYPVLLTYPVELGQVSEEPIDLRAYDRPDLLLCVRLRDLALFTRLIQELNQQQAAPHLAIDRANKRDALHSLPKPRIRRSRRSRCCRKRRPRVVDSLVEGHDVRIEWQGLLYEEGYDLPRPEMGNRQIDHLESCLAAWCVVE